MPQPLRCPMLALARRACAWRAPAAPAEPARWRPSRLAERVCMGRALPVPSAVASASLRSVPVSFASQLLLAPILL